MEDRITLTEAFHALAGYGAAFWCGAAAGIATFIIEIILCQKGILFAETCTGKTTRPHADGPKNQFTISRQKTGEHNDKPSLYCQL